MTKGSSISSKLNSYHSIALIQINYKTLKELEIKPRKKKYSHITSNSSLCSIGSRISQNLHSYTLELGIKNHTQKKSLNRISQEK